MTNRGSEKRNQCRDVNCWHYFECLTHYGKSCSRLGGERIPNMTPIENIKGRNGRPEKSFSGIPGSSRVKPYFAKV